ncbi:MAG: hypothetical protein WCL18_09765 [bacterium]
MLGGIGKVRKPWTEILYRYLLPKAKNIIVRDRDSATTARERSIKGHGDRTKERGENEIHNNVVVYQDFAQEIILRKQEPGTRKQELESIPNSKFQIPYILININRQSVDTENMQKIITFCGQYPDHKKIFFPCDMNDDKHCFSSIKKYISDLEMYDRTKHLLTESLSFFHNADAGIGARLHFLLPLKLYEKPIVAIPYADKINKLIISTEAKI